MFNAIEVHCLVFLRDCANRLSLRKRRPWLGVGQEEMKELACPEQEDDR